MFYKHLNPRTIILPCCAQKLLLQNSLHTGHYAKLWEHQGFAPLPSKLCKIHATRTGNPLIIFKMGMVSPPPFLKVLGQTCPEGLYGPMNPNIGELVKKETEKKKRERETVK